MHFSLVVQVFLVFHFAFQFPLPQFVVVFLIQPHLSLNFSGSLCGPQVHFSHLHFLLRVLVLQLLVLVDCHFPVSTLHNALPLLPLLHSGIAIVILPLQLYFLHLFSQASRLFLFAAFLADHLLVHSLQALFSGLLLDLHQPFEVLLLLTSSLLHVPHAPQSRLLNNCSILH